jgi:hypothetical protein
MSIFLRTFLSPSLLSNYLHEGQRVSSWRSFEERLKSWLENLSAPIRADKVILHTKENTIPSNEIMQSSFYKQYYQDHPQRSVHPYNQVSRWTTNFQENNNNDYLIPKYSNQQFTNSYHSGFSSSYF